MSQSCPHLRSARSNRSPVYLPPEIYLLIGRYVTGSDLAACALVSMEWNAIFSSFLYMSLGLYASPLSSPYETDITDSLGTLIRATLATRDHYQIHGRLSSDTLARYGS